MKDYIFVDGVSSHFFCKQKNMLYVEYETTGEKFAARLHYTHTRYSSALTDDVFDQIEKQLKGFCHYKTTSGGVYLNKKYIGAAYCSKGGSKYYLAFTKHGDLIKEIELPAKTYKKLYADMLAKYTHKLEKEKILHKEKMFLKMKEATAEELEKIANHIDMLVVSKDSKDPKAKNRIEKLRAKHDELKAKL